MATMAICLIEDYTLFSKNPSPAQDTFFDKLYDKFWQRCGVYYIGLYMGICFVEYKKALRGEPVRCKWMHFVADQCRKGVLYRWAFYLPGLLLMTYIFIIEGVFFDPAQGQKSVTTQ